MAAQCGLSGFSVACFSPRETHHLGVLQGKQMCAGFQYRGLDPARSAPGSVRGPLHSTARLPPVPQTLRLGLICSGEACTHLPLREHDRLGCSSCLCQVWRKLISAQPRRSTVRNLWGSSSGPCFIQVYVLFKINLNKSTISSCSCSLPVLAKFF